MSTPPRYLPHSTVADHAAWQGDWEFFDGVAVAIPPSPLGRGDVSDCTLALDLGG